MKFFNRIFAVVLAVGLTVTSCEFTELDLQENPNAPGPESAELEFLYNNIQLSFNGFQRGCLLYTSIISNPDTSADIIDYQATIHQAIQIGLKSMQKLA